MLALVNWGGVHLIPLQPVHFKVIRVVHFILIRPVHLKVIWTVHLKCRNHFRKDLIISSVVTEPELLIAPFTKILR